MLLKIGELAKRTGLTVRTLHHYDEMGLLSPSIRSDGGYRLYGRDDVARLYRILALRQLGLPLAEIGACLAREGSVLPALIDRQLHALDAQIAEAVALRDRLQRLSEMVRQGEEPELADWLTTLEMMMVYDKYFTAEEQAELSQRKHAPEVAASQEAWPSLIAEVRQLMASGVPAADPAARAAAARWSALVLQFTGGSPNLLAKSAQMMNQEQSVQSQTGIDPAMMAYIAEAVSEARLETYARYLNEEEMVRMRANYGKRGPEWLPLIAQMRAFMDAGTPPESEAVQVAAQQWELLTQRFAGTDPATREKIRHAMESEPNLLALTGMDLPLMRYVRSAGAGPAGRE